MASKPLAKRLREGRNRPPDGPWAWLTREMLECQAWRSLSLASLRVVFRVMIEHMAHAGTENGNLAVTYADFTNFGIRTKSLKKAIDEAVERGLVIVTQKGRRSAGPDRWPARYALGWLPLRDGSAAMNRWKDWKPKVPIPGNIESTGANAPKKNGRNYGSLRAQTPLAPTGANAPREMAEINNSPRA